jgi:glucose/mannose transport system permease protein
VGTVLWTVRTSLSSSRTFPRDDFVGLQQFERLMESERWLHAIHNLAIYGVLFITAAMVIGFLLAVFIDQKVRGEGLLRTAFLYPYAMSFVATGLVWQWVLNPESGLQNAVRQLGWSDFTFDWIVDQDMVIYTVVIAGVWQGAGLVMALMLAGLRGIDEEIWKAARLDGIPTWRVYLSIVLPMLAPTLATVFTLLAVGVVKVFDTVVAMTQGGPGIASDVPAKFIMDHLFSRANLGLASAGAVMLLLTVLALVAPLAYVRSRQKAQAGGH